MTLDAGGRKGILCAEDEVLLLCVFELPCTVALKLGEDRGRQVKGTVAREVLWSVDLVGFTVLADLICDVLIYPDGVIIKVDIIPCESESLATSTAGDVEEFVKDIVWCICDVRNNGSELLGRPDEHFLLAVQVCRWIYLIHYIGYVVIFICVVIY